MFVFSQVGSLLHTKRSEFILYSLLANLNILSLNSDLTNQLEN